MIGVTKTIRNEIPIVKQTLHEIQIIKLYFETIYAIMNFRNSFIGNIGFLWLINNLIIMSLTLEYCSIVK